MKKYYLIYKITNIINDMIYVGCHITNNKNDNYMGSGKYLVSAQKKYGLDKFNKEILFECSSQEEMIEKERNVVNEAFISRLDTYNLTIGGYASFYYINKNGLNNKSGQRYYAATKIKEVEGYREWFSKKVSIALKERFKKHPHNWIGRKHTEESKAKIARTNSILQKGERNSQYGTCWIFNEKNKENKKIKEEDLEQFLDNGWKKGRKMRFHK